METPAAVEHLKIITQRVFIDNHTHQSFHIEDWTNGVITMGRTDEGVHESPQTIESELKKAREVAAKMSDEEIAELRKKYSNEGNSNPYSPFLHPLRILFEQETRKAKLEAELTKHH